MGQPSRHPPALLLLAAFSRHDEALAWARRRAEETWGPVVLESPAFGFEETHYYDATMGAGLRKAFWTFEHAAVVDELSDIKLMTNAWEEEYAALGRHDEARPLNLDPGYLTLGKLILASTKDFAHRIYLARGIFAEVTLYYRHHHWQHHEFTFADYRRADYQAYFSACRDWLHERLRHGEGKRKT